MVGFRLRDSREIQLMSNNVSDCMVRGKYVVALELDHIAMYTFLRGKILLLWKISVLYKSPNWQETSLIGIISLPILKVLMARSAFPSSP